MWLRGRRVVWLHIEILLQLIMILVFYVQLCVTMRRCDYCHTCQPATKFRRLCHKNTSVLVDILYFSRSNSLAVRCAISSCINNSRTKLG